MEEDLKHRQRTASASSAFSFFSKQKTLKDVKFTSDIRDYEILNDIGGIEDVSFLYLAKHKPSGEVVALKYTDLNLSPDFEFLEEMIRTSTHTKLCRHPRILPYFLTFVEDERLWSVTYPISLGTCRTVMKNSFPHGFNEVIVATILKEVLRAVAYMHENHMIHNDIRADNIVLDMHGDVRLTGLRQMAHLSQNGEYLKAVFSLVGDNIEWAAPEVMSQNSNYDEKADMYSIGITALELALNKTPFDDWPPLKILLCKMEYDTPAIISEKIFSPQFYRFVAMCLQKDPASRPSAEEALQDAFFKQAKNSHYLETYIQRVLKGLVGPKDDVGKCSVIMDDTASSPDPLQQSVSQLGVESVRERAR